jgi:hypothetical protein
MQHHLTSFWNTSMAESTLLFEGASEKAKICLYIVLEKFTRFKPEHKKKLDAICQAKGAQIDIFILSENILGQDEMKTMVNAIGLNVNLHSTK